jgi:hypothetical protein
MISQLRRMLLPLLFFILFNTLVGCTVQSASINNVYRSPRNIRSGQVAVLINKSKEIKLLSIDGKSISVSSDNLPIFISSGNHTIYFYLGKNNYFSGVNHMLVLKVLFKPNQKYVMRNNSKGSAWVENSNGLVVSSVISNMSFSKDRGF